MDLARFRIPLFAPPGESAPAAPVVVAEPAPAIAPLELPPLAPDAAVAPAAAAPEPVIAEPKAGEEAPIPAAAAAAQQIEPSLISAAVAKTDAAKTEIPAPAAPAAALDVKTEVEAQPPEKPKPIEYKPFKFPADVTVDPKILQEKLIDPLKDYQIPQEVMQTLVDNYVAATQQVIADTRNESHVYFRGLRQRWRKESETDPRLRNRLQTAIGNAQGLIKTYALPEDQALIFQQFDLNGMGDYPPMLRLLDTVGAVLNVAEDGAVSPAPAAAQVPKRNGRGWYDKTPTAT